MSTAKDAAADDLFVVPSVRRTVAVAEALVDPFKEINEKNKILAALKADNIAYKKDATQQPVTVVAKVEPSLLTVDPQTIVEQKFK